MSGLFEAIEPPRDVLILGAGFSRALSARMPLTDELGNACLGWFEELREDRRVPAGGFSQGRFETWLSELAADQPYLGAHQNLENHALFLRFSEAIATVLGERVLDVLSRPWPWWLPVLLKLAHVNRTTLITFNYDPLVECAVATGIIFEPHVGEVPWTEVIGDVPSWTSSGMRWGGEPADTMLLLKLHGSLNWYWTPEDYSGVSVARRDLPGRYGEPREYNEDDRRRELPGRVPFVVPPSATKAPYYSNPIVRELWRNAADALQRADRIVLMGYSIPVTDLTFNAMLSASLREDVQSVVVADPDGLKIRERLERLGLPSGAVVVLHDDGEGPIAAYVRAWCREIAVRLAEDLRRRHQSAHPMVVAWGKDAVAAVVGIEETAAGLLLQTEATIDLTQVINARPDGVVLPTLERALWELPAGSPLLVKVADDDPQPVIGWSEYHIDRGYGHGVWNMLVPAGARPGRVGAAKG